MTGTAETEASEFANTYNLPVVPIPTNRPMVRDGPGRPHLQDRAGQVRRRRRRPRSSATRRASPCWSAPRRSRSPRCCRGCSTSGASRTRCSTPSSTPGRRSIVAQAGRLHAVTVATNMAGRGVDILLGGNPEGLAQPGRAGRRASTPTRDEGQAALRRSCCPSYEDECQAEGDKVRELGGLYVLGTERHESRRIDNQLRGRSGRQGDPGESRFYLSLEDELMRLFATGAMSWVMGKALPDDVPIEAKMVTKAIERAQNTVEAAQRRDPQGRPQVRRGDERAAQGDLPRRACRSSTATTCATQTRRVARRRRSQRVGRRATAPPTTPRTGTSTACSHEAARYYPTKFTAEELRQADRADEHLREPAGRGHRLLRAARAGADAGDADADARDRARGHAADHRPALA